MNYGIKNKGNLCRENLDNEIKNSALVLRRYRRVESFDAAKLQVCKQKLWLVKGSDTKNSKNIKSCLNGDWMGNKTHPGLFSRFRHG